MISTVSVVIPLYNKGHCIGRALDSVLTQTYQNIELIVVNDGSTDNGPTVVKTLKDPRIILITQENKGPGAARNTGLQNATGEYIAFLDADDEWIPTFLQEGVRFLNIHKEVATFSSGYYDTTVANDEITRYWNQKGVRDGIYELSEGTIPELAVNLISYVTPCTTIARKKIINKYGGFFDKFHCLYGEDSYLWLKVILNEKIAISRQKLVVIHREDSNLSNNLLETHPLSPDLQNPISIEMCCPTNKKNLLMKMLAIRAMEESKYYSSFGLKEEANKLLKKFCCTYKPNGFFKAKLYMYFSFIIKHIRKNQCIVSFWRKRRWLYSKLLEIT